MEKKKRVVIYARYSSENQKDESIEELCKVNGYKNENKYITNIKGSVNNGK